MSASHPLAVTAATVLSLVASLLAPAAFAAVAHAAPGEPPVAHVALAGIDGLIDQIADLDPPAGDAEKLVKELDKVRAELGRYEFGKACARLDTFVEEVDEQAGKGDLLAVQAEQLTAAAEDVRAQIGCDLAEDVLAGLDELAAQVGGLEPAPRQAKKLVKELDKVRAELGRYEFGKACKTLDRFLEEVDKQADKGDLLAGQAASLTSAAEDLHDAMGCGVGDDVQAAIDALVADVDASGAKATKKLVKVLDRARKELGKHKLGKACKQVDRFVGEVLKAADARKSPLGDADRDALIAAARDLQTAMGCFGALDPVEDEPSDMTVSKAASATEVTAGTGFTYTITVENAGPGAAADVVATDTLHGSLTITSADWPGGSCSIDDANTVTCELGTLDAGEAVEITIAVTTAGGACAVDVTNQASVAASNEPAAQQADNDSGTVTVTVADPDACDTGGGDPDDGALRDPPPGGATGTTSVFSTGQDLYTGSGAPQTVADPSVFEPGRAGIASGRVLDRDGNGIPGVRVGVLGDSDVGHTLTQSDGTWDMAVNGGGELTFDLTADGLLPAQRTITMQWQDWAVLDDVVMIPLDPASTEIDLAGLAPDGIAVHTGTTVTDGDGTRTPHVLFSGGTTAELHHPDGTIEPAPNPLVVRVTEYTIGERGPAAMPAELPPASAYTYAAEFSVDGVPDGTSVEFSQPVTSYLQDIDASSGSQFLGFPVGLVVPLGSYDRRNAAWDAELNGHVVGIVGETTGGLAEVDTTGDDGADNGTDATTGVLTDAERRALADLFDPGDTVWRATISHFTPIDLNHPIWTPDNTEPPDDFDPFDGEDARTDDPFVETGYGTIEAEHQVLRETIALPGAGQALHYSSDRVPGRARTLDLRVAGSPLPAGLVRIEATATVAGKRYEQTFDDPATNQRWTVAWDGRDRFGRSVQGQTAITARITYVYEGVYAVPADTAQAFGLPTLDGPVVDRFGDWVAARIETSASRDYSTRLGGFDARVNGLGGWTLSDHHSYDPMAGVVHLGDGTTQGAGVIGGAVETVAGTGDRCNEASHECVLPGVPADETPMNPDQVTVAPDGTAHLLDASRTALSIGPGGTVSHLAGADPADPGVCAFHPPDTHPGGSAPPQCDTSGPVDARSVLFDDPSDIQMLPDGDVLIADADDALIYRVDPATHHLTVFAGTGEDCDATGDACGDGGPATQAALAVGFGGLFLAVADEGTVYLSQHDETIRRIGPEGIIETFLGASHEGCASADCGNGGPAGGARINNNFLPMDVGPDGSLYFVDIASADGNVVRRVTPQGVVEYVAGGAEEGVEGNCSTWDGLDGVDCSGTPYDQIHLGGFIESIAVGPDGSVYLALIETLEILRIEPGGVVERVVGVGFPNSLWDGSPNIGSRADGVPGPFAEVLSPTDIALGPDGSLYWATGWWWGEDFRLRRLTPRSPTFDGDELVVPAQDGSEVWVFDPDGRHLETRHGLTGATLRTFGYDSEGRLTTVTDGDGNETSVQRDGSTGHPTAIGGPFGQTTTVDVGADGWLKSVTTPAGRSTAVAHDADGLLTEVQGARPGATYGFDYDAAGRLTSATDPGGTTTLSHVRHYPGSEVTVESAEGRATVHGLRKNAAGEVVRETTHPDGTVDGAVRGTDGSMTFTARNGTVTTAQFMPDPRFGPVSTYVAETTVETPGGLERTMSTDREVVLEDDLDPFSIDQLTNVSTVNGRDTTTTYDGPARTVSVVTPEGRTISGEVDEGGRVTSAQFGDLAPTTREFDARGRLCRVSTSDGTTTRETAHSYGSGGAVCAEGGGSPVPVEVVDALGQVTSIEWDDDLRPATVTDPEGQPVSFAYDATSNLVSVTPPGQPAHTQTFDSRDLQTGYAPAGAASSALSWTYGADGLPELLDRADGTSNDPTYDGSGRLVSRVTDHATYGYAYDSAGRLAELTSTAGAGLSYGYDGGLLTSIATTGPAATTRTVTLDADFRQTAETIDAGTPEAHSVGYGYDDDGLVTSAGNLIITRDPETGFVTGTTLGDVITATTYNGFGDVATHTATAGGTSLYSATYGYDALGRVSEVTEDVEGTSTTRTYTYDGAGRLTQVDEDGSTRTYAYDANGNRIAGPGSATGSYDDQDRIQSYGGRTYSHDPAGDLDTIEEGASTRAFDYDADGNLHGVSDSDGPDVSYTVDARGRRTSRTDPDGTTAWSYRDGVNPVAQYDDGGSRQLRFVFGTAFSTPDYLVDASDSSTKRVITDHSGSPRLVVDAATAAVVQRLDYDEFGQVTSDSNPGYQPYGFQGGLHDPDTGFVRFGARDYDPTTGRFTTRDPILFAGGQANAYEFVTSDPVNFTDPSGLGPDTSFFDAVKREAGYFRDGAKASGPQLIRAGVGGAKVTGGVLATTAGTAAVYSGVGAGPGVVAINFGLATTGSGAADIAAAVTQGPDVSTSAFPSTPISAAASNSSPEVQAIASTIELAVGGGVGRATSGAAEQVLSTTAQNAGNVATAVDTTATTYSAVTGVLSE